MGPPRSTDTTCRNCEREIQGDFCHGCGQAAHAGAPLTIKSVLVDVWKKVSGMDDGVGMLIRGLFTRPAAVCREYIQGKRKPYGNPLNFLFIAVAASSVANYYAIGGGVAMISDPILNDAPYENAFFQFLARYFHFILFLGIPVTAFFGRAFFSKPYNYAEHLLIAALLRGASLLMFCFFAPLLRWKPELWHVWIGQYALVWILYFVLTYVRLFAVRNTVGVLKTIAIPLLTIVVMNGSLLFAFWLLYT